MFIFALNNCLSLAKKICQKTNLQLGTYDKKIFNDGEIYLQIKNQIKGQKVFVLGSTYPPSDNIVELLILINALKENKAKTITLIFPYFAYARQDKLDHYGAPITAKLLANILKQAGVNKFITIDLHSQLDEKYLGPELINLTTTDLFADYIKKHLNIKNTQIIAPDNGAKLRALQLAKALGKIPVLVMTKTRPEQDQAKIKNFSQNIKGKNIIMTDDIISTAGTIMANCRELKLHQVKDIYVLATFGILAGPAIGRIKNPIIEQVLITDAYPLAKNKRIKKIKILAISSLLINYLKNCK